MLSRLSPLDRSTSPRNAHPPRIIPYDGFKEISVSFHEVTVRSNRTDASGLEAGRQRYFTINWIQFATTWAAFALFLVALISL
jgi:hypothetical protein